MLDGASADHHDNWLSALMNGSANILDSTPELFP
jgi:hypothetical protein